MLFNKQAMEDMAYDDVDTDLYEVISNNITDHGRWDVSSVIIFKYKVDDKFYKLWFSKGATESQDGDSFDYETDPMECEEVFPVEITVTKYYTKEDLKNHVSL